MGQIMTFKKSPFNVVGDVNSIHFIWNTLSGAVVKLDENAFSYYQSFTGGDDNSPYFSTLRKQGFLVPYNFDQVRKIIATERETLLEQYPKRVNYVIAPGMGCNYNCSYCFEKGRNTTAVMTKKTALAVAQFICCQADNNPNLKSISIKWFGGEPLLYLEQIKTISSLVMKYASAHSIRYEAGIITNGSLLTRDVAITLKTLGVTKAQITIDGLGEDYCISKGTTKECFSTVVENICSIWDVLKLTIRLNIPNNDEDKAIQTADYFYRDLKLLGRADLYFAFVRKYESSVDESDDYRAYANGLVKWARHVVLEYGIELAKYLSPKSKTTSCGYIRKLNYCIGPSGELYKCEHCIGNTEFSVGDVWRGCIDNRILNLYMQPLSNNHRPKCLQCPCLPICLGGCANDFVTNNMGIECKSFIQLCFSLKLLEAGVL